MKVVSLVDRQTGQKRPVHVADVTADTLKPVLQRHVDARTTLMTDEAAVYKKIAPEFAGHESVNTAATSM